MYFLDYGRIVFFKFFVVKWDVVISFNQWVRKKSDCYFLVENLIVDMRCCKVFFCLCNGVLDICGLLIRVKSDDEEG